jgi:hypothetical protein
MPIADSGASERANAMAIGGAALIVRTSRVLMLIVQGECKRMNEAAELELMIWIYCIRNQSTRGRTTLGMLSVTSAGSSFIVIDLQWPDLCSGRTSAATDYSDSPIRERWVSSPKKWATKCDLESN